MKEQRKKAQLKNKEPKEEIIVNLGERKNKTENKTESETEKKSFSSLGSSLENVFNEEKQLLTNKNSEKIRQNKDFATNVHEESADATSKW